MIRAALILATLAIPAHAQDNNPFSGAREIRVVMVRDKDFVVQKASRVYDHRNRRQMMIVSRALGGHHVTRRLKPAIRN